MLNVVQPWFNSKPWAFFVPSVVNSALKAMKHFTVSATKQVRIDYKERQISSNATK